MKTLNPQDLDLAFLPADTVMFSELIQRIQDDWTLPPDRARDMVSGLRRIAKALGRPPEGVPADARWLQPRLARIAPAALGLSSKSWSNVHSNARAAMALHGLVAARNHHRKERSPSWRKLWEAVVASKDAGVNAALRRFVQFLNRQGVAPDDVCDQQTLDYLTALELNETSKSPDTAYRSAVNNWNLAVKRVVGWPQQRLSLPPRQKVIKLPAGSFPGSFDRDVDRFINRITAPDPFAPDARMKPVRPATAQQYRRHILRLAADLVHAGVPAAEIVDLATLFQPAMAERGLRHMLGRNDNKSAPGISEVAALLRNIGKTIGCSEEVRKELARLASRVAVKSQAGMTRKSRDRLRVLQDEKNLRRLLLLPERLFQQPRGKMTLVHMHWRARMHSPWLSCSSVRFA